MNKEITNYLVECSSPEAFDQYIQQLGAAVLIHGVGVEGNYKKKEGFYIMRVFGNAGFLKSAMENQGYGKVIRELEELT